MFDTDEILEEFAEATQQERVEIEKRESFDEGLRIDWNKSPRAPQKAKPRPEVCKSCGGQMKSSRQFRYFCGQVCRREWRIQNARKN